MTRSVCGVCMNRYIDGQCACPEPPRKCIAHATCFASYGTWLEAETQRQRLTHSPQYGIVQVYAGASDQLWMVVPRTVIAAWLEFKEKD